MSWDGPTRLLAAAATALTVMNATPAMACSLEVGLVGQPQSSRVAGFALTIRHGMVLGLRPVPAGWRLRVDNDPSWTTRLDGHAVVGAAFLSPSMMANLIQLVPEPPFTCGALDRMGTVRVTVMVYRGDMLHRVRLPWPAVRIRD